MRHCVSSSSVRKRWYRKGIFKSGFWQMVEERTKQVLHHQRKGGVEKKGRSWMLMNPTKPLRGDGGADNREGVAESETKKRDRIGKV